MKLVREIEITAPGPTAVDVLGTDTGLSRQAIKRAMHRGAVWLRGSHPTLAVRVTGHPLAAAICDAFGGPVVSTSANTSGRPPALTAIQARLRCPGIDLYIAGPTGGRRQPSEIRDARTHAIVRAG